MQYVCQNRSLFDPGAAERCERVDDNHYGYRLGKTMRSLNWPAVRAFNKAIRELSRDADLARAADHTICPDGYGTRDLEDAIERSYRVVAMRIAPRFGLTANELGRMMEIAGHVETDCFILALQTRSRR